MVVHLLRQDRDRHRDPVTRMSVRRHEEAAVHADVEFHDPDPGRPVDRGQRRQPGDRGRPELDAAAVHAAVPGVPVGPHLDQRRLARIARISRRTWSGSYTRRRWA